MASTIEIRTWVGNDEDRAECIARVNSYTPAIPAWTTGWEKGEPAIMDFDLLDPDGKDNHELWELATNDDISRISAILIEEAEAVRRYGDC